MNKKGQLDYPIITFAILVIALMIFAPITLKIFRSFSSSFSSSLGNVSGGGVIAAANFEQVTTTLITFWDKVIIAAFILAVLLLFVSAFLIDAHPFFIIIYILFSFMLVLFAPNIITAVDHIYDNAAFAQEVSLLPFLDTLRNNFAVFLVGIIVITGIIIYGKLAFFGRSNNRK
jgi:hypothetical protein